MRDYLKFYIDGAWVDPVAPRTLDVINPATEGVAGRISLGGAADVDKAVKAARKAFETHACQHQPPGTRAADHRARGGARGALLRADVLQTLRYGCRGGCRRRPRCR